jgi:undecaprenyl-diphosphatase
VKPAQATTGAISLVLFLWLARVVGTGAATAFDSAVRAAIHNWSFPALTTLMKIATFLGTDGFMAVLALPFLWHLIRAKRRNDALRLALIPVTADLLLQILKHHFHRPRPEPFFNLPTPDSFSFPSGHALMSTVFYVTLAIIMTGKPALLAAALALATCIGLSRIYLGVHYPTDVLAGFIAGTFWLSASSLIKT